MLKARKQGLPVTKPAEPVDITGKRYLILTLTSSESDKVHFPMPLNYLEDAGIEVLRRTLTRMHSQMEVMDRQGAWSEQLKMGNTMQSMISLSQLEQENLIMREQIEGIERQFS